VYLRHGIDYFDLDEETVWWASPPPNRPPRDWDFGVRIDPGYNPLKVLEFSSGRWFACLPDHSYDETTEQQAVDAELVEGEDAPCTAGGTLLILTDKDSLYKVGQVAEDWEGTAFRYAFIGKMPDNPPPRDESVMRATIPFEVGRIDLDTGVVLSRRSFPGHGWKLWEFEISYNARTAVHSRICRNHEPGQNLLFAYFRGRTFESVTAADIGLVSFEYDPPRDHFDQDLVVLCQTNEGAVFKIGNPWEREFEDGLTIDFARLSPPPVTPCHQGQTPVGVTLAVDTEFLDLDTGQIVQSTEDFPSGNSGWDVAIETDATDPGVLRFRVYHGPAMYAVLQGQTFGGVTHCEIPGALFRDYTDWQGMPVFDDSAVYLVNTDQNVVYKVGMVTDNGGTVDFSYSRLTP
jgi:hypothetical protein